MLLRKDYHAQAARVAFTLMEMMVVVAIIIVLISISGVVVFNYWNNSKIDTTKAKIQNIQNAVMTYQMNNGPVQDLSVLLQPDREGRQPTVRQQDLIDAWGNQIVIDASQMDNTGRPLIYSQGPPGQNKPIRNFDLN
jgi:type II secretory pathway pseudopilin PulG